MSITTQAFRLALTTAALCAAGSTAHAKPKRVVVLDFDGPHQLAEAGRSSVLALLGEQYDVVATKRWEQARAAAAQQSHGPAQWSRAAKQSGVDAVIEGWVQDEGRRKILNVVVREADNGREFDTITVRIDGKNGISTDSTRQLQTNLDEVLDWIDAGQNETTPTLPIINPKSIGPSKPADDSAHSRRHTDDEDAPRSRTHRADDDSDADAPRSDAHSRGRRVASADDDDAPAEPAKKRSKRADSDDTTDAPAPAAKRPAKDAEASDGEAAATASHDARPTEVSAADREAHEIDILFPQSSEERKQVLGAKVDHIPQKTPRFMIDGGFYYGSRSLIWDGPPDANVQQAPGMGTKGFQLNASIYPFPQKAVDGILSGVGFTGSIHHSVGSSIEFDDTDEIDQYVINQNGWELGIHYRTALSDLVTLDGGAFYGSQSYQFVDASQDFEVPDTQYSYLGASVHLDLNVTDRATIGFGARYFTVLDAGDLASTDFYGPADASGIGLEATFLVPLPENLYVRGQLSYQRISLDLSGGGIITDQEGLTGGTDSMITGSVNLGIAF